MPEYVRIYDNRQDSDIAQGQSTQVNEYLLRNRCIQNLVKDLRWSALEN